MSTLDIFRQPLLNASGRPELASCGIERPSTPRSRECAKCNVAHLRQACSRIGHTLACAPPAQPGAYAGGRLLPNPGTSPPLESCQCPVPHIAGTAANRAPSQDKNSLAGRGKRHMGNQALQSQYPHQPCRCPDPRAPHGSGPFTGSPRQTASSLRPERTNSRFGN